MIFDAEAVDVGDKAQGEETSELSSSDLELVEAARETIKLRYQLDRHVVAAALKTRSGRAFTGVHLEANVGRIAVCAEAIALGRAATEAGDTGAMPEFG